VTSDLKAALKTLALGVPTGTPINVTLLREDLLELVNGTGNGDHTAAPAAPDRLVTVPEAAQRCGLKTRYIYAHADQLPFVKRVGRRVRCSELRLARWMERR
jgi:predicted DNA-binding transcriptional regulator AlpA